MRHLGLLALAMALGASPAPAAVIEIRDDGSLVTYGADTPKPPRRARRHPPALAAAPPRQLAAPLAAASDAAALSPELVASVAWAESRFDPGARSRAGAQGLMQLMPATARELGVDPANPAANLRGGAAYLRALLDRYDGDLARALAAYNAGPGAVDRHRGIPPFAETRAYVARVLARLAATALTPESRP